MKNLIRGLLISGFAGAILFVAAGTALAATPVLSVTQSGGNMALSVTNADAYATINLYQKQSSSAWTVTSSLGTTDANGSFSNTGSLIFDGSSNPLQVYVLIDNLQSNTVSVSPSSCSPACGSGTLSMSQTNVTLSSGQTSIVTAYPTSGTVYVSGNTNTSVASYNLSGNQITVYAINGGSTTITVCTSYSQCGNITVSVNGGSSGISFSNANPVLGMGTNQNITIYSSYSSSSGYYISSNSNPNIVSTSINASTLVLTAQTVGTGTILVCQSGSSYCGSLYVTVNNTGNTQSNGTLNLSTSSLTITPGQSSTVTVSNSSGALYITSNSSPTVVSAGVNGQTINLYGIATGSSTLLICQNGYSGCSSLYVAVNTTGSSGNGAVSFSNSNPVLAVSQTQTISIYSNNGYSGSYFWSGNTNPYAASISLSGATLSITALNLGSTSVTVCQSSNTSACGNLTITISNTGSSTNNSGVITFSSTNPILAVSQTQTISIYSNNGYSGSYFVSSNSNPSIMSAYISGSLLSITNLSAGSSSITVCQSSNTSACGTILPSTTGASSGIVTFSTSNPVLAVGQTQTVSIYSNNGYTGSYSVTSNSNPSVLTVAVNGSSLSLTGNVIGGSQL